MKFRILHQGLLLISIPLICVLSCMGVLLSLDIRAEQAAQRAAHAREISDAVASLIIDIHNVASFLRTLKYNEAVSADFSPYFQKVDDDLDRIARLTADKPEFQLVVQQTQAAAHKGQKDLKEARTAVLDEPWKAYSILQKARKDIDDDLSMTISPELIKLASQSSGGDQEREAEAARGRSRLVILVSVLLSIVATVGSAFLFTRRIANRVAKLCDDSRLLARGEDLMPVMSGSDEIAELDRVYHQNAQLLAETARKLQSSYDYAADLILSVNNEHKIIAANQTSQSMLSVGNHELSHVRVVEIVAASDRDKFLELLKKVRTAGDKIVAGEISLRNGNGGTIETNCLMRHSAYDKATVCVFHDITDRKEAERIRNEVFSMVTHDLRTPLASFGSFIEMIEMGGMGKLTERAEKLLPMAEQSVKRMARLLDDILILEKIKSGALELESKSVSVNEMLGRIASSVYFAAQKRGITLDVEQCQYSVLADQDRLEQVLLNFLSNALKFSPRGSTIKLFAYETENKSLSISIRDSGPGIEPDELDKVFKRFYQRTKGDSDLPSTGLGLSICQDLAALLGAKVDVQSKVGVGSIFSVVFPRDKVTG